MKRPPKQIDTTELWLWAKAHDVEVKPEHRFHPVRKWRFDYAVIDQKIAIEIEGVVRAGKSRHTTIAGYRADCEKYNAAIVLGWRVMRYTQDMWRQGAYLEDLEHLVPTKAPRTWPNLQTNTFKQLLKDKMS